jgi:hypothetical protein
LATAQQVEQERAALLQHWQQRRERAAYDAERAARQYHAVEPEHRLVARTLERAWEEQLAAQQQLEEAYHRFLQEQPRVLSDDEREAIRRLAADIPALWDAPTTTAADRKEILRQVVERVEVAGEGLSERVQVRIRWVGGTQTEGTVLRPIARLADRSDYARLCERVRMLATAGWSNAAIARQLAADGYPPGRARHGWGVASVCTLRVHLGLTGHHHSRGNARDELDPGEWWAADLARHLAMPRSLLHHWIGQGRVRARQEEGGHRRWIIRADATELECLRRYRHRDLAAEAHQRWHAPRALPATPERR